MPRATKLACSNGMVEAKSGDSLCILKNEVIFAMNFLCSETTFHIKSVKF